MGWFFAFIAWIALTIVACKCALNRGRSVVGWLVFCIFLSPVIALIAIFCLPDLKKKEAEKVSAINNLRFCTDDFIGRLSSLCELKQHNMIDENEFCQKKNSLINELAHRGIQDSPEAFLGSLIPFSENNVLSQHDIGNIKNILLHTQNA